MIKNADHIYCASTFLMYRTFPDRAKSFLDSQKLNWIEEPESRIPIKTSFELEETLRQLILDNTAGKKCALALSGGIDSAALLKFMPQNTIAYTFRCEVPGIEVTDESKQAAKYIQCLDDEMEHKVIPITWADMAKLSEELMTHKAAPIHSIEVQIYKAAVQAKADGCDIFVFGEDADCVYGGHSKLFSRDWNIGDFIDRFTYVFPYKVLKEWTLDLSPYYDHVNRDGYIDVHSFLRGLNSCEAFNSYANACELAGIELFTPYAHTEMAEPLDLARVRSGENKYLVREMFRRLYPGLMLPPKTPMPRPTDEWLADWEGPTREEFWPHCTIGMTGDQKWLVWALERFLNVLDEKMVPKPEVVKDSR